MAGGRYEERVRDLLVDARAAAEQGDWTSVRDLAEAAVALSPGNSEARELLDRADTAAPSAGERRQLTVMFCDVVGSTALSEERDPELVREVLRSYQATCDAAVRRYEGRISRYIGDGILAFFGHPLPHEDDARRAVKAGLDLLDALRPVTEEVRQRYGIELGVRVAVHTGVVIRAEMGSAATPDRDAIVGETPNLAARLQDHARPGTLVISQDTYELVRGWFLVAPLGALDLRGLSQPVTAYEVVEETATESRVQAQADLSPYVGRESEQAALADAWREVQGGGHRMVVVSGQAGVGKSRLADVLRRQVQADGGGSLIANCSTYHGTTALFPVRRLLERAAGIDARQGAEHALPRLWNVMEAVGRADSVPLLADLLEIPPTSWCPPPELDGSRLHDAVLTTLVGFVAASAGRTPLLLVVDDVQWADPSTLELVGRLAAARVPRLLLVLTTRDEVSPPWRDALHLPLDRLSVAELGELAQRLPEGRRLPQEALDRAIERSDGIPFFLEELLRSTELSHGFVGEQRASDIPPALRDLLLARYAAPGVDLQVAQLLATIGGEATQPVVAATLACAVDDVEGVLRPLLDARILVEVAGAPIAYRFRHHLLAELAYDTQLRPARERAHSAVADALRSDASSGVAAAPSVIAHHLEEAGRLAEAVEALIEAGEAALELGATAEVAGLLDHALDLVAKVPGEEGKGLEFQARLLRGVSVSSTQGYSAPQAVGDFERCQELAESQVVAGYLDDLEGKEAERAFELVQAIVALWANQILQGRLDEADATNRSLIARFRPGGDMETYTVVAGRSLTGFFRGSYDQARSDLTELVRVSGDVGLPGRSSMPNDPVVSAMAHLAYVHSVQGDLATARSLCGDALTLASGHAFPVGPFSQCYVQGVWAAIELAHGFVAEAGELAARQAAAAERHGFALWALMSGLYQASVDHHEGDETGSPRAAMIISMLRAMGVLGWVPTFLAALSAVHLARGDAEGAIPLLADARAVAEQTGAHLWTPEILRQQGEAALVQHDPAGVDLLREAVRRAVDQQAHLHEVWARTSLCRHVDDPAERRALADLLTTLPLAPDSVARVQAEAVIG